MARVFRLGTQVSPHPPPPTPHSRVIVAGGGDTNSFGDDFKSLTGEQGWTADLCTADSDGDGLTNGFELGDPCCLWASHGRDQPAYVDDISHPGRATGDFAQPSHRQCSAVNCTNGVDPCNPSGSSSSSGLGTGAIAGIAAGGAGLLAVFCCAFRSCRRSSSLAAKRAAAAAADDYSDEEGAAGADYERLIGPDARAAAYAYPATVISGYPGGGGAAAASAPPAAVAFVSSGRHMSGVGDPADPASIQ